MGSDEAEPRDPKLRARGIEGPRIVDASAMPDLVSAHINACGLMMTEKAADLIRGAARARVVAETVLTHQIGSRSSSRQRTGLEFVLEFERAPISPSCRARRRLF